MTQQFTINRFGGLVLNASAAEVGLNGATDLLDVEFDRPGAIRTRDGYAKLNPVAGAGTFRNLTTVTLAGIPYVVASDSASTLRAYIAGDGSLADSQATSSTEAWFARFGTPTAERLYCANGTDTVQYLSSTPNFLTPVYTGTTPTGRFLAVQPRENRLVNARTATNTSRVLFSDAGDPHTFGATNFVDLDPGDGEEITGLAAWGDFLFAFKQSKFYVFYGNDTDSTGAPVFNYRTISGGQGCYSRFGVATAPEGVFFIGRSGIWVTTGGRAVPVSDAISPLLRYDSSSGLDAFAPFVQASIGPASLSTAYLGYADGRLLLSGLAYTLVYRPARDAWSIYNWQAKAVAEGLHPGALAPDVFFAPSAGGHLMKQDGIDRVATDDGAAITSRYRSGLYDLGHPGLEKRVVKTRIWGTGSLTWKTSRNWDSLSTGQTATLGVSPAVEDALVQSSTRAGHLFSHELSATSGQWAVESLTHEVDGPRHTQSRTP